MKKYIDDDGSGIFPKQKDRIIYNAKYQEIYGNMHHVLSASNLQYTRVQRVYLERNKKATCLVYLQYSTYCDAEGSP